MRPLIIYPFRRRPKKWGFSHLAELQRGGDGFRAVFLTIPESITGFATHWRTPQPVVQYKREGNTQWFS